MCVCRLCVCVYYVGEGEKVEGEAGRERETERASQNQDIMTDRAIERLQKQGNGRESARGSRHLCVCVCVARVK